MQQKIVALLLLLLLSSPVSPQAENSARGNRTQTNSVLGASTERSNMTATESIVTEGAVTEAAVTEAAVTEGAADGDNGGDGGLNIRTFILDHLADSYEWQIMSDGKRDLTLSLPVILYSKNSGWHIFLSSRLRDVADYKGFRVATDGNYRGKIVEIGTNGTESRPLDLSLTKNAAALLIASALLILLVMGIARSFKREPLEGKKGFVGMMEMLIASIYDDVIEPSIGQDARKYAPYLLTLFFFIFFNNLLGLVPFFPGGANVTGNIAVTLVLALATFLVINLTGTKGYYKELFWPDVPTWLKAPIPFMQAIEIIGTITKPFSLMIRLFANIMAGHSIVIGLTMLIFITMSMGTAINASMTVVSVLFSIFINFLELLIAFIQAYVFTLLSAVFIGQARVRA